jgi:hypothetical protein
MDALHGMGGIGKSVLARALCDDPAVQAAFPDVILWATLGQTPDLIGRRREWIDALGGIVSEEELGGRVHPVPVMAQAEAVALLEEWAQGGLNEVEAEVKAKIVRRLGCLPLAVRLAGAQLARKDPAEWLASFDARKLKRALLRIESLTSAQRQQVGQDALAAAQAMGDKRYRAETLSALAPQLMGQAREQALRSRPDT